jgi:ribosomal protein L21E
MMRGNSKFTYTPPELKVLHQFKAGTRVSLDIKGSVNSAVQEKLKMKYILFSNVLNMNQTGKN